MQQQIRQELAHMLGLAGGQKDVTPAGPYNTGPGGNFNLPGVNREFISLVVQPEGLAAELPLYPSMYAHPQFGYITGFTGATGTRAQGVCDDARIPGGVVTCIQTAEYGRYRFDTKPIDIRRVGLLNNRADPLDLTLMNGPLWPMLRGISPANVSGDYSNMFNPQMELVSRMTDVAREFSQQLAQQLWYGDPADVDGNTDGEQEYPGLDILVGTTKIDARTGIPCDALKSDIKDFNNWDVTRNGGQDLFNALYYIVQTREFIARKTNMGNVTWNFVMRQALWDEIVKVWPCIFATYGCQMASGPQSTVGNLVVDGVAQRQFAEEMAMSMMLPLTPGKKFRVVIDDALAEESLGSGCLASDIWFLPRTVKGGRDVLFKEYLNWNQGALQAAQQAGMSGVFRTDNGKFLWWNKPQSNTCIQLGAETDERVVLLTPHLAGRLNSVGYCPLQHAPDSFEGQLYSDVTGVSVQPDPNALYSDWNPVEGPGIHETI